MRLNSSLCNCLTFHFSIKFRHKGDFFLTAITRFPSENIIHGWLVFGESLACNNYAAVITFKTYKILSQSTINRYAWETFKFTSLLLRLDSPGFISFLSLPEASYPPLTQPPTLFNAQRISVRGRKSWFPIPCRKQQIRVHCDPSCVPSVLCLCCVSDLLSSAACL